MDGEAFAYAVLDVATETGILSFWAIDDAAGRPTGVVLLGEVLAWPARWGAAPVVLRVLPEEVESVASAAALGMREVYADGQKLPYRWFVPQ